MKERKAYIMLACLSLVLSVLTILFVMDRISESDHKWCQLIQSAQPVHPPAKPLNPGVHPDQDAAYHKYKLVYDLGVSLGCL